MQYKPKPQPERHTREPCFLLLPAWVEDRWVWLEWVDRLYDNRGDIYYRLPVKKD